jgi:hypothetical protein
MGTRSVDGLMKLSKNIFARQLVAVLDFQEMKVMCSSRIAQTSIICLNTATEFSEVAKSCQG